MGKTHDENGLSLSAQDYTVISQMVKEIVEDGEDMKNGKRRADDKNLLVLQTEDLKNRAEMVLRIDLFKMGLKEDIMGRYNFRKQQVEEFPGAGGRKDPVR